MMNRIVMGLRSGMPTEVSYSLSQLVRISYEAGDELRSDVFPGLSDMLFAILRQLPGLVTEYCHESVNYSSFTKSLEKINEAALILRNMSMVTENAMEFARSGNHNFKPLAADILSLRSYDSLVESKSYTLDMVEALAVHFPNVTRQDRLFDILVKGLDSDDRGQLCGSLRALVRMLMGRDEFNRLSEVPMSTVERITALLMLEDEELVSACLDFLYQYTTNEENVARLLGEPWGFASVKQLVRLLCFHGITGEQLVYVKSQRKPKPPVPEIPVLPMDIVTELLSYPEPDRATKWYVLPSDVFVIPHLIHHVTGCAALSPKTPTTTLLRSRSGKPTNRASTSLSPLIRSFPPPNSSRTSPWPSPPRPPW